jgi:chorismate dehydratase
MIKAALVSYLNTKPFLEGLEESFLPGELEILLLPPAECAQALAHGECDIALVPAGSLFDFEGIELLKDFCLGADGPVDSVFLFAGQPAETLETILEDPHSRTSNLLAKLLMDLRWNRKTTFLPSNNRDFTNVGGTTGRVAIGDLAHQHRKSHPYIYDLSGEWKKATGLPFVFAVWAYRPDRLSLQQVSRFSAALEKGISLIPRAAEKYGAQYGYSPLEAAEYLSQRIHFHMNAEKHEGLKLFFSKAQDIQFIGQLTR